MAFAANSGNAWNRRREPYDVRVAETTPDVAAPDSFLESLTSGRRPGLASTAWARRAETTRLVFVDAKGEPLAGLNIYFGYGAGLGTSIAPTWIHKQ